MASDYWTESRRPLVSLAFLLPLLGLYEFGVLWLGGSNTHAVRNGADTWMRGWLLQLGIDRPWILPMLIVVILAGWHVLARHPWQISRETLFGMFAESLLCAILLLVAGQLLSLGCRHIGLPAASFPATAANAVSYIGAGIYEEVLFRLLLLPAVFLLLRGLLLPVGLSALLAIFVTSLVFSMAHYLQPGPASMVASLEPMTQAAQQLSQSPELWFGFGFRLMAGLVFAGLFLTRGFGVTVGCHAFYDLMVGILMTAPDAAQNC